MEACNRVIIPVSFIRNVNIDEISFFISRVIDFSAFCRNYGLKKWYKFDDHTVSTLDKSDVKSSATYILFYTSLPDSAFIGGR
jgi:Ubiquitin carboxyl-terminal hydrolase